MRTFTNAAARTSRETGVQGVGRPSAISVLFVVGSLKIGGTERHLSQIVPELQSRGIKSEVYLLGPKGPMASFIEMADIPIIDGMRPGMTFGHLPRPLRGMLIHLANIVELSAYLRRTRPMICHLFLPAVCVIGGIAGILARQTYLVASRRSLNNYQVHYPLRSRLERRLLAKMSAVLGNSRAVVEQLKAEGVPAERVGLIYNGIDLAWAEKTEDRGKVRKREGITKVSLVMLSPANLIHYKGHADLFAALSLIQSRLPRPWMLLCVGRDDGQGQILRAQAETLGISRNVRFLGERENVYDLYRAADIGVLCSHEEGFPNTLLEAMTSGLPMVATNVGGIPEAVIDDECGLLVPPRNSKALGEAILKLALNKKARQVYAQAGRKRVEVFFSLDRCAQRYENLYRGLMLESSMPVDWLIEYGVQAQSRA
jgi:glycosyltransferase involved in cell wall biosynthesis